MCPRLKRKASPLQEKIFPRGRNGRAQPGVSWAAVCLCPLKNMPCVQVKGTRALQVTGSGSNIPATSGSEACSVSSICIICLLVGLVILLTGMMYWVEGTAVTSWWGGAEEVAHGSVSRSLCLWTVNFTSVSHSFSPFRWDRMGRVGWCWLCPFLQVR